MLSSSQAEYLLTLSIPVFSTSFHLVAKSINSMGVHIFAQTQILGLYKLHTFMLLKQAHFEYGTIV